MIDVYKRGPVFYYSIIFTQHSDFYDYFDAENTIDGFIEAARNKFVVTDNAVVQGCVYLVNYQPAESNAIIKFEDKGIWLTDVCCCVFLINFKGEK